MDRVRSACDQAHRDTDGVHVIAVSKTRSADEVRAAYEAGMRHFGENYLQDALPKVHALHDLAPQWHFIGRIQANKTRDIATHFDWVHTVDRLKVAKRLDAHRQGMGLPLNVLVQVNVDADADKAGVGTNAELDSLVQGIEALPNLALRGLMTILSSDTDPTTGFKALQAQFARLATHRGSDWNALSMGMSNDFETAIACGATHVRIGTAIFGPRETG